MSEETKRAVSESSATTSAIGCPLNMILLSYSGRNGEPFSGATSSLYALSLSAIGGRFLCVSTAITPPTFMASLTSMLAMRPFAIVDETTLAKARSGAMNSPAYFAAPVNLSRPSTREVGVPMYDVIGLLTCLFCSAAIAAHGVTRRVHRIRSPQSQHRPAGRYGGLISLAPRKGGVPERAIASSCNFLVGL